MELNIIEEKCKIANKAAQAAIQNLVLHNNNQQLTYNSSQHINQEAPN